MGGVPQVVQCGPACPMVLRKVFGSTQTGRENQRQRKSRKESDVAAWQGKVILGMCVLPFTFFNYVLKLKIAYFYYVCKI